MDPVEYAMKKQAKKEANNIFEKTASNVWGI